jgi:hypothetical protein
LTGGQSDGAPARYDGREEDGIGFDLDGASDARLIQLAAAGDGVAFEHLYGRFARPVRGLALRQLRDAGRAEEVVQETFAAGGDRPAASRPTGGGRRPGCSPWLATPS